MVEDTCEEIKPGDMTFRLARDHRRHIPRVGMFYLVNTTCSEVMVDASSFMSEPELWMHIEDKNAVICPVPPVKGVPFVSTTLLAKSDPRWDTIRTNVLRQITD